MPKDEIDYSNTIIYKIFCKDNDITDTYIGHTTNFSKRKYQHKISCNNLENKLKIYEIIREKGGWDNWNMIEIAKYNCKDNTEARIKEQEHYQLLKASLNSCPPYVDKTNWFCVSCNLQCNSLKQYETHINCNSHKTYISEKQKDENNISKYYCEHCNYKCIKKYNWSKHLDTSKHKKTTFEINSVKKWQENGNIFECKICNKLFFTPTGLWNHKKTCTLKEVYDEITHKDLLILLVKQNKELLEVIKNGIHNTNI